MAKKRSGAQPDAETPARKVVATNRRARYDYEILETVEAGIVLTGSEVKSLREGRAQIAEAFARVDRGELWLHGMHIPPYKFAHTGGHEPVRPRKLLVHRKELDRLSQRVAEAGLTLVPMKLSFVHGLAKIEIGVGRGKKHYDKRQSTARRDADREMERSLARRNRR